MCVTIVGRYGSVGAGAVLVGLSVVAYRWQSSGLLLAATYCAQLFVAYRAIGSIIQLNAWLVNICLYI